MKPVLLAFAFYILPAFMAPADTLPSGVYRWKETKAQKSATGEKKDFVKGSTRDLEQLQIHASTLAPGKTNHPPRAHAGKEELIIVREGRLQVTINGTPKTIGPGGIALILPGDEQSFQNTSGKPVTYYVLGLVAKTPVNTQQGKEAGGSLVRDWSEMTVKKTDKGERRDIFDRPSSLFRRFEVHATALDPGFSSHDPHTHRAEEIILLIKGKIKMQIGQAFHPAAAGDIVFLASGDLHAAQNTGKEQCGYFAIQWNN